MGVRWVNGGGPSALCGGGPKKRGPFLVVGNMLISRGSNLKKSFKLSDNIYNST